MIIFLLSMGCLLASGSSWGAVCEKFLVRADALSAQSKYALPMGQSVKLAFGDAPAEVDAVFIGRLVGIDGVSSEYAFYEPAKKLVHVIPLAKTTITTSKGGELLPENSTPVVRSINQEGGTCAAFSIVNCFRQMHYLGHEGNGALKAELEGESSRTRLLVRAVNATYVEHRADYNVLEQLAASFGFKVFHVSYGKADELKERLVKYLKAGWPVALTFDVPDKMATTEYTILDHGDDQPMSRSLWKPKSTLAHRKGGHMIVAVGLFEAEGKTYVLMSDPNWQAPRFWELDDFDRARSASIAAYVLWDDKAAR